MTTDQALRVSNYLNHIEAATPTQAALFKRAYYGPTSKALALKAKCLDCCAWQRDEVRNCTTVTCPLWRVRPFQTVAKSANRRGVNANGEQ